MTIRTVAILSPGEMGHAVGRVLREHGLRVTTCLANRSNHTAARAAGAGIKSIDTYETLVQESDIVLSILVPSEARACAEGVAKAMQATGVHPLFVECNAIAPQSVRAIDAILGASGASVVDAGIIGGPPAPGRAGPRFYASGAAAGEFALLARYGLDVRTLGAEIGQASGFKMCYAALTKGLTALTCELLIAAEKLGLAGSLHEELAASQSALLQWTEHQIPSMPAKAHRWVGEMEEIGATFAQLGLPPTILLGAAELYHEVAMRYESLRGLEQGEALHTAVDVTRWLAEDRTPAARQAL